MMRTKHEPLQIDVLAQAYEATHRSSVCVHQVLEPPLFQLSKQILRQLFGLEPRLVQDFLFLLPCMSQTSMTKRTVDKLKSRKDFHKTNQCLDPTACFRRILKSSIFGEKG